MVSPSVRQFPCSLVRLFAPACIAGCFRSQLFQVLPHGAPCSESDRGRLPAALSHRLTACLTTLAWPRTRRLRNFRSLEPWQISTVQHQRYMLAKKRAVAAGLAKERHFRRSLNFRQRRLLLAAHGFPPRFSQQGLRVSASQGKQ